MIARPADTQQAHRDFLAGIYRRDILERSEARADAARAQWHKDIGTYRGYAALGEYQSAVFELLAVKHALRELAQ